MTRKSNEENRKEWVKEQLSQLPAGTRLLDAGAGEQQYRKYCSHLNYISQDFSKYNHQELKSGLQMDKWEYGNIDIVSDIISIPQPDSSFDAVLCTEVLEHVPDPVKAIEELARLLKRGGKLIITAPFCSMTHFAPYHYSSGFNSYYYEYHLRRLNFSIEIISFNGNYFDYLDQELRRVDHIALKYNDQKPSWLEYQALKLVRKMTNRFARSGNKSEELLTLGIHVTAIKK